MSSVSESSGTNSISRASGVAGSLSPNSDVVAAGVATGVAAALEDEVLLQEDAAADAAEKVNMCEDANDVGSC